VLSILAALGFIGWMHVSLNAVSVGAPALMLTLAVADNIHILTTMFHCVRQGLTKHQAVAMSLRMNFKAVFLTSITTILGFLTMNFSESPPLQDLGNLVGIGVTIDLFNSILLLPALIAVLPVTTRRNGGRDSWVDMNRMADFVIRRRRLLLNSMLVAAAICSLGMLGIRLDDNFLMYFDDSFEFRRATDFMIANLRGWTLSSIPGLRAEAAWWTPVLETADRSPSGTGGSTRVSTSLTIFDTIKRLNGTCTGATRAFTASERRDLRPVLLLYEMSLPAEGPQQQIDSTSPVPIMVELPEYDGEELARWTGRPAVVVRRPPV
jgi:hypothetical protein